MGLRERQLGVAIMLHSAVVALAIGTAFLGDLLRLGPLLDAGGFLLLFHLLTFRRLPLARLVQQLLIRTHRCRQCGLEMEMVESWKCSCGYIAERHAFSPCPQCGKGFAWIGCSRCGAGALI